MTELTDLELVARFQAGCQDSLETIIARYRRFARAKARGYFLIGADSDDIEQEGMIGLYKAARDFRPERQASFRAFAELCITRQIITAVKTSTRNKHTPLNEYVSFSQTPAAGGGDGDPTLDELLPDERVRAAVRAEGHELPADFYDVAVPVPAGWPEDGARYVQLSGAYDGAAAEARARGWTVVGDGGGSHLDVAVRPERVADLVLGAAGAADARMPA